MAGSGALFKVFHRGHVDLGKESTRAEIANKTGNLLRERPAGFNVPTTFPPCGYSPLPRAKGTIVQSTLAYGGGPLLQSRRPGRGDGMLEIAMSGSILHSGLQFVDPVRTSLCIGYGSVLGTVDDIAIINAKCGQVGSSLELVLAFSCGTQISCQPRMPEMSQSLAEPQRTPLWTRLLLT